MIDEPAEVDAIERWMRSPTRRAALIATGVVALAGVSAIQLGDLFEAMGRPRDVGELFVRFLVQWALWGLVAVPIVRAAVAIARIGRPLVVLAGQLLLGLVVAVGMTFAQGSVDELLFDGPLGPPMRPSRSERSEAREPRSEPRDERPERDDETRRASRRDRSRAMHTARNSLVYAAVVGVGLAVVATLRARDAARRSAELSLTATRLEVELGAARMTALQRQLRPHFLLNALHAVGGLVRQGRGGEVQEVLAGLGALLRTSLRSDDAATSRLASELELVRHYLDIEAIRLGDRLVVDVPEVDAVLGAARVPTLLLLPLVENAVQHGVAPREEGGRVTVAVEAEGDDLVLVVQDDGPGFGDDVLAGRASDDDTRGSGASIGLANTRARLALIPGASLALTNDGGARVTVRLPLGDGA